MLRTEPTNGLQRNNPMSIIAVIILVTIIADFTLHIAADVLNLRAIENELPEPFHGWYDADQYRKSQEYLRINTRFNWLVSAFDMLLLLVFWFGKGFPILDYWVRSWGWGPIVNGLVYFGILIIAKAALMEPFSIYATFVIEQRFGFNTTTWRTYIVDHLKGLVLLVLIGAPLLAGILAFFEYFGPGAWWRCWVAVTGYTLLIQFVAPT